MYHMLCYLNRKLITILSKRVSTWQKRNVKEQLFFVWICTVWYPGVVSSDESADRNTLNVFHSDCECTSRLVRSKMASELWRQQQKAMYLSLIFRLVWQSSAHVFDLCLCSSVVFLPSRTMVGELAQMTAMNINYRDCCYTGNPGEKPCWIRCVSCSFSDNLVSKWYKKKSFILSCDFSVAESM